MGFLASRLTSRKLTQSEIKDLSNSIVDRILRVSQPDQIYLFGSFATGQVTESSDIDVAVIYCDKEALKAQKKLILHSKLFLDHSIDFLFFSNLEFLEKSRVGGVCNEILNNGCLIYDKRTAL